MQLEGSVYNRGPLGMRSMPLYEEAYREFVDTSTGENIERRYILQGIMIGLFTNLLMPVSCSFSLQNGDNEMSIAWKDKGVINHIFHIIPFRFRALKSSTNN